MGMIGVGGKNELGWARVPGDQVVWDWKDAILRLERQAGCGSPMPVTFGHNE